MKRYVTAALKGKERQLRVLNEATNQISVASGYFPEDREASKLLFEATARLKKAIKMLEKDI